jgi:hypothetical protein
VDVAASTATDVTLLVNNAGVLTFGAALDGDLDLFQRDVLTNYVGMLRVALFPSCRQRPRHRQRAHS